MTRVQEAKLHFLVWKHVGSHLRADFLPGRSAQRKMIFNYPLPEWLAHDRPSIINPEFIPDKRAMLVGCRGRGPVDHAIGKSAIRYKPVMQLRVAKLRESKEHLLHHISVALQVIARHHRKRR